MSAFTTKATETKTKKVLVPTNNLQTDISIWPVGTTAYGVAIKLNGAALQSKLLNNKAEILSFLEKVL